MIFFFFRNFGKCYYILSHFMIFKSKHVWAYICIYMSMYYLPFSILCIHLDTSNKERVYPIVECANMTKSPMKRKFQAYLYTKAWEWIAQEWHKKQ